MDNQPVPSLAALDALVAQVGLPVRAATLDRAWDLAVETPTSRRFQERVRQTLDRRQPTTDEITLLVTLRAKPGRATELEQAAQQFVEATRRLEGALGSTLFRSANDPLALTLLERFSNQEALSKHMASAYFERFRVAQEPLLAEPVAVTFLERLSP